MYMHSCIHACAYVTDYYASLVTDIIISRQFPADQNEKKHSIQHSL